MEASELPSEAVGLLVEVCGRVGITASFGPCSEPVLVAVARELPISPTLRAFYARYGPHATVSMPAALGEISLYSPSDLVARQAGYRWDGVSGQRLDGWPDAWVVIADHAADPFIADTAAPGTPVGVAVHGAGSWRPYWVASGLASFLMLLACCGQASVTGHPAREDEDPAAYTDRLMDLVGRHASGVDSHALSAYLSH